METRIEVGILGATGMVGQHFIKFLQGHPWFELTWLGASDRSAGKKYRDAAKWHLDGSTPANVADLVGMTIASEAVVAGEASLRHAAVCTVDNLANGIEDEPLSLAALEKARWRTGEIVLAALRKVLPVLAPEKADA